ncbi:peptide ABC transporter permease [Pseudonocardia sulfidoxydans NBRC 16205]|uniref:Peptide ABC transporter permease n=1 Tax=Pseudonocardia sulfidoxydans NBRC 16205 TaxID=1223511 RepID=A0A511DTX9_9PSEU|nr:ABC transporter permease [Pseudonocardia sulfidoxydans]GEL26548.1 peptide ABC transporter permease [Pseudonocardia sulfidoxydans NBRC 16205]
MGAYVVRRLVAVIPIMLGVALIAFLLLHLAPGDPISLLVSNFDQGAPPDLVNQLRERYGLNDPLWLQYVHYVWDAVRGDLGTSIFTGRPVTQMILDAAPYTAALAGASIVIAVVLGVTLGVVAAVRRGTWWDNASIGVSLFGLSIPQFWFGMMAVLIFAVNLHWFPSSGSGSFSHLVLPALVLGISASAAIARLTRSAMLEVLGEQYIVTARAKGLREVTIISGHALKNAFIPVLTLIGLQFGRLLGGTVIMETIFNRQGLGTLMLTSITRSDFPLLQGTLMVVAAVYVLLNIAVDVSYAWFDPRVRL